MAAITQRVSNYLGGVSKQSDDKKLPNQVRECLNGYPDPTFGLTKRPGFKWITNLGTGTTYDNCKWFYIHRDDDEKYIGCIKPASIAVTSNGTSGATDKTGVAVNATSGSGNKDSTTVNLTASGGVVTGITFKDAGSNFATNDTITITAAAAGTGANVVGTITLGDIDIWNATSGAVCNVYYDAKPWANNTSYVIGDKVINGGKIYVCDQNGLSVASGSGPSGTGSDIADNTARWDYVSAQDAQSCLTGLRTNYDVLTVQDTSIICNNLKTVEALTPPTYNSKSSAALVLSGSPIGKYNIKITDEDDSNVKTMSEYTSPITATYDELLTELKTRIDNLNVTNLVVTKYDDALHLVRNNGNTGFKITATGGVNNDKLSVVQDVVDTVSDLPFNTIHGRKIKVVNTDSLYDTYWAEFIAEDGVSGRGYWAETMDPTLSKGLLDTTMPHELVNPLKNIFIFRKIVWTGRTVGDDVTNPQPSFVGAKIQQSFFHNSRLGFLSKDNVTLSQSQDFYNFYAISAQTQTDSDPVDLSCSAIRPAALHGVIPTTQGLVLFSQSQQFLMGSGNGILTPTTTTIRTISNYEMDTDVDPVDMGTNINFISKTPAYTRVFGMVTRGQDENPQVLDVGRVVNEWIPSGIDTFIASPQNQFLALSNQSDDKIYFYRTYSDGKENVLEAWFNWQLMGNVQGMAVDSDDMFAVTKQGNQFTLSVASLSQSPSDAIIVNNDGSRINPCIDLYTPASNAAGNNKVDYDATNEFSKCYIPWNNVTGLTPVIIIKGTTATGQFIESGFTTTPTVDTSGSDPYFKVEGKDLTSVEDDVIVGWKYDLDVILPKTYVRTDQSQRVSDFTASLTVSRMKFSVGLSGVMAFKLKSTGVRQGKKEYTGDNSTTVFNWIKENLDYIDKDQVKVKLDGVVTTAFTVTGDTQITMNTAPGTGVKILIYLDEWYNLNPTQMADTYLANDIALSEQSVFTIPIHQKSTNFQLRIFNDSPFPVSLNSMMWEGNYSPRFYKRF